jgi:hypothetical protein
LCRPSSRKDAVRAYQAHQAEEYPGSIVRAFVAIVSAAALLGAASTSAGTPTPNVRGSLTRGPVMPVCIEGRSCDAPAPGVVLVFSQSGQDVKRLRTGVGGRFAVHLQPGSYQVRTLRKPLLGGGITPARFRVPAGSTVSLRLHLDSGIR